ncbi:MAG: DUF6468 domain-containing protein [Pseudomonadota bacterium]
MNTQLISLVFEGGLVILLIATIAYCSKLSKKIRFLQNSRSELAGMIGQFDHATDRAMTSVNELQNISKRITDTLQLKIEKANFLADDLAFLIEKSSKLVVQLEQIKISAEKSHELEKTQNIKAKQPINSQLEAALHNIITKPVNTQNRDNNNVNVITPRTGAERELIEALKASRN